jgi:hypothetical protein
MTWEYKENVAPIDASEAVKGLWNVHEDEHGNSSLRTHTPRTIWQSCLGTNATLSLPTHPKENVLVGSVGLLFISF